jgi:phage terminase large subunit GpA-like protein
MARPALHLVPALKRDNPTWPDYAQVKDGWLDWIELLNTNSRMDVAEAAEEYRVIYDPDKGSIKWKNAILPYMVEPQQMMTSRRKKGVIMVAPAQSGKTEAIVLNVVEHAAVCQPRDVLVVEKSHGAAKDFSKRRLDRMVNHTPALKAERTARHQDDNVLEKIWRNGAMTTMVWPSKNELAGRPVPVVLLTDYDRMPQDVDGEGAPYWLAQKRTTTFGSKAMTAAESSPSFDLLDPSWIPKTPHEAPPCQGIVALYNYGDRRRWYWPCSHCDEWFEPIFDHFAWDNEEENAFDAGKGALLCCPHCGGGHTQGDRAGLNRRGVWLADGQRMEKGEIIGEPPHSDIASYWVPGPAAAFQDWAQMVTKFINSTREFEATGSEESLKTTVNTDQCKVYIPKNALSQVSSADLESRASESKAKVVPSWVRFLVGEIDVQANRFAVQVTGVGVDLEVCVIDRFDIRFSPTRKDDTGAPEAMDPASYLEDWDAITPLLSSSYPLETDPKKEMVTSLWVCDSGGAASRLGKGSVTEKAYRFWRELRKRGLSPKFHLLKGDKSRNSAGPAIRQSYPDSTKGAARSTEAKGDVPVWIVRVDSIKDIVSNNLMREEKGPGYYHFPSWLGTAYFEELSRETKDPKKGWQNLSGKPNEAWDLCVYAHVAILLMKGDKINWDNPPGWAKPQNENGRVISERDNETPSIRRPIRRNVSRGY